MKDQKNLGLPEQIFIPFWCHFHVLICKKQALAVSHLTVTLRMMSLRSNLPLKESIVHVQNRWMRQICGNYEEIDRDITCRMIAAIFLSLLRSELYSPLVSSIGKWSLITVVDLRLLLIIPRVTAWWETAAAWFFKSKSWKLTLKSLKICSGNPKFFRSIT